MVRKQIDVDDRKLPRTKTRRAGIGRKLALATFVGLGLIIFFLPKIATSPAILSGLIDRFAGITPLKVSLERAEAGWFSPIRVSGIKLIDGEGTVLATIGDVSTEKGILGWVTDSSNLGKIKISQVEASLVAHDGTTNIEQAIAPVLEKLSAVDSEQPSDASGGGMLGTVELTDSKFLFSDATRQECWEIAVPKLSLTLPTANQLIGPIDLQATVRETSGTAAGSLGAGSLGAGSLGTIAANVHQSDKNQAFEVRAKMENVPIDFWNVIHSRLPDVPINSLTGRVSAVVAGSIVNDTRWSFDVQQLDAKNISIDAPELVGASPAKLTMIAGAARCSLVDSQMQVENARLVCDFASTQATASIPWPLELPTATNPFLPGASLSIDGSVDLPKLAQAAASLIPLRQDTQLLAGTAQFSVSQQLDPQGVPSASVKMQLDGLDALASGQRLTWTEPLTVELTADKTAGVAQFGGLAKAEFLNVQGRGTIEAGQFAGNVNLDLLQKRLSQWIELPIDTMTGAADLSLAWSLQGTNLVGAQGKLSTTPLVISTAAGKQLQEPAWQGEFAAQLQLDSGTPQCINLASIQLQSQAESLSIDLQSPLFLVQPAGNKPAPAAFKVDLRGDLANLKRRGTVWLEQPPEVQVDGTLQLALNGLIDLSHVEVLAANWSSQPLRVTTPSLSFFEPTLIGKFAGRVDSSDLTRLVVDVLQIQSSSFSIGAQDAANSDGSNSRLGRAKFIVDLDRLMKNANGANGTALLGGTAPTNTSQLSVAGQLDGDLAWQVNTTAAGLNLQLNGKNIYVLSQSPGQTSPQPLWDEPSLTAGVAGTWVAENNAISIEQLRMQTAWMSYAGNLAYRAEEGGQTIEVKGQAVYDSAKLTTKLLPYTGGQVQFLGQQTVPVQATWSSSKDSTQPMLAGLQASLRLGWQQALVAGIVVGQADVPVTITNGHLLSAAEMPVSGGALRWDINTDLTADEIVIVQKPMTVLENVEITQQMCDGWLKYIAPLLAETTSIDGRLSLKLDQALLSPADPLKQKVAGMLIVHNATVGPGPLSNQVIGLVKQLDAIRKKDFTQPVSSTQRVWMDMPEQQIEFQMTDGKVMHRNLNVKVGDARLSTSGTVAVDGQLELLATMPIPDDWVDKSPWLAGLKGQSLQFPMRGTISKPQVDTQLIQDLGRQTAQNAASGMLQQSLNKGLNKLLGAPATDPATGAAAPQGNNPLQGLGQQIFGGQGVALPGIFPPNNTRVQPPPSAPRGGN